MTSTGIYCRPICPARTARRSNVRFFETAAAAVEAGFRPCLRCRPEVAPGTPAWSGTSTTVSRALRLIAEGALDERGIEGIGTSISGAKPGDAWPRRGGGYGWHCGGASGSLKLTERLEGRSVDVLRGS